MPVFAPSSSWDERRNSSRVFPVAPDALPKALDALAAMRRNDPALVQWILDGHPSLTEFEHRERFGEPYQATRSKKVA